MNKYLTSIKVSSCEHLLFLKKRYLGIGMHLLEIECKKSNSNDEFVYSLCEFITVTRNIILFFIELIKKESNNKVKITEVEAAYIKLYLKLFRETKHIIGHRFNHSVELH